MGAYVTLVKRELTSLFYSWTGYVVMAVMLLLLGFSFNNLVEGLNNHASDQPVTEVFYSTMYFWLILLLLTPVITMRTFAQEKATGTFETLLTTPVSDAQILLAKFTGAWLFFLLLWLPLGACVWLVRHYSHDPTVLEAGSLGATYAGIAALGALYIALGCFASSLTRSQVNAMMISLGLGISLFLMSFLSLAFSSQAGWRAQALTYVGLISHMEDFAGGVVDTRPLVFYCSLAVFFLFLTSKTLESRRWK